MNQLFHSVLSLNKIRCRVWLLRSVTSSVTSGDERWIRTVLKDPHPVVTQRVSERVSGVDTHNHKRDAPAFSPWQELQETHGVVNIVYNE